MASQQRKHRTGIVKYRDPVTGRIRKGRRISQEYPSLESMIPASVNEMLPEQLEGLRQYGFDVDTLGDAFDTGMTLLVF